MSEQLVKTTKIENRDFRFCFYKYFKIISKNGVEYYRRDKFSSVKWSSKYAENEAIEYRQTSKSFALSIDAKKWEGGKADFFTQNSIEA